MRLPRLVASLFLVVTLNALLFAQTATTSLRGTITDPKGAVVSGANVTLSDPATGFSRTTKSDAQGAYQFLELPPASYVLNVEAPGFASVKQTDVKLMVNVPATINIPMQVSGGTVTLEVTGEAPLVNTTDATLGHAFGAEQIANLPFEGRDPTGILSLQPGVVFTGNSTHISNATDSRSGSVNGARSDQTNVTLDGVDNNDQLLGTAFQGALRVPLDSLQEFRVTTANSEADTGRSSGGQVSLVTKAGTNNIHGSVYEYHRPTFTTANDWFNKQSQIQNDLHNRPPRLLRNTFGANIGGPIKKDRLFFFLAYEGQRKREDLQVTRIVPSANLRQGIVSYLCTADPTCPAGGVETLSAAQMAAIDTVPPGAPKGTKDCLQLGTCAVPGPNPAVLAIFQKYPLPNTDSVGDGFNFRGFTFSSPLPLKEDAYVAKLDYNLTSNGNHRVFVRGVLDNDKEANRSDPSSLTGDGGSQFPGDPSNRLQLNNSKGLSVGYTATFSNTLINNFRFGYIRQGISTIGQQTQHYVHFRGMDDINAFTPTTHTHVPVWNYVDDITKVKGSHTFQFGANYRKIDNIRDSNSTSFFFGDTNGFWLANSGIAGFGVELDPAAFGLPAVDGSFSTNYDFPVTALTGLVTEVNSNYNLTKALTPLPEGAAVPRHFRNHEAEFYGQDSWRVKPNLTLTYGLRYTLLQPPYETTGTQVAPDVSLHDWFWQRGQQMLKGLAYEPLVSFSLSGQANGKKPYWGWDYKDIAPRFAVAYSPSGDSGLVKKLFGGPGKTSIRAGYGIYFDHFGEGIVNSFDRNGSFGLTTSIANPAGIQTVAGSARFTGLNDIPTVSQSPTGTCAANCPMVEPPPSGSFPVTPPSTLGTGGYAITWGLDDKLKTPYSHVVDFSITRELPKAFVFEASYVGRFAHRLLQEEDLAMPTNLIDPKSGMSYFQAATLLAQQYRQGVPISSVQPIPFWENFYPGAAGPASTQLWDTPAHCGLNPGVPANVTATQAMYDLFACFSGNETTALEIADVQDAVVGGTCFPTCASINGVQTPFAFYSPQWSSLYGWMSTGNSNYNAGQFSLRHAMTRGLQFDLNYTFSKSIDVGSNAERINQFEGGGFASQVINSWFPAQLRAVSDFDTTHAINANWVYELPFGQGKRFGSGMGKVVNAFLGGWTISGLWRWSSGYPFSVGSGFGWATNFELESQAVLNGKRPETGTFTITQQSGNPGPNVFRNPGITNSSDPNAAINQFRQAFPGESGQRNELRGPGTFNIDTGISKSWRITEAQALKFTWEVFNVTNTPRFDVGTMQFNGNQLLSSNTSFGNFSSTLSNPRVMEFALRYTF
jgi:Carboxypeptidase regulatory-like domain